MKPNFFILGAPKCGTTSLARWLETHPNVYFSPVKEPHYFSTDLSNRVIKTEADYRRLFEGAGPEHLAIGEASTWYLYSQDAVANILRVAPEARFVVMTRNPVDMAWSLHHHNLRVLHEDEPDFARAWALQGARRNGSNIPPDCSEPAFLQYLDACALGAQIARLLAQVPAERVLHLSLDQVRAAPARSYRTVLDFLSLPDDERTEFPVSNVARGHRSPVMQRLLKHGARLRLALGIQRGFGLARLNEKAKAKQAMDPALRKRLEEAFAEDVALRDAQLRELAELRERL